MDLARHFYGDGSKWRHIASANHLKGGGGNTPIFKHWYPHRISRGKPNVTMTIPKKK
jgi:nucleoid-associated protein YgaU